MMKHVIKIFFLSSLILFANNALSSALKLHGIFTHKMVLQRDTPAAIYGYGLPGDEISVEFAGQKAWLKVSSEGKWKAFLSPLQASFEDRTLIVSSQKENISIELKDVLVGDVWLASGQSNMARSMRTYDVAKKEITGVENRGIRIFHVDDAVAADEPSYDMQGEKSFQMAWQIAEEKYLMEFSPAGYFMADRLSRDLHVPIGVIHAGLGATEIASWLPHWYVNATPKLAHYLDASYKANQIKDKDLKRNFTSPLRRTSGLYNGIVAPLNEFILKGFIWCQGESNSKSPLLYRSEFPGMIQAWRKDFGQGDLPFLFVEIAPHGDVSWDGTGQFKAFLREAQSQALSLPNTGMVTTVDIGEFLDIHPQDKRTVGERLARLSMELEGLAIEGKPVKASPPRYRSMTRVGSEIEISFDRADEGLHTQRVAMNHDKGHAIGKGPNVYIVEQGEVKGFTISGKDRHFVEANVVIKGSTIFVSSDQVTAPVAVRYAWSNFPLANLATKDARPVPPFRTDNFEIGVYE